MKKRILAALLAAATMMSLTACGGSGSSTDSAAGGAEASGDSKDVKIAYIVKAKSDEFWTTMEKGALAYAEEKGIQVDFQAPEKETDVEKQVQFVENAVIKGYDAIILSAADSKSLAPAVAKANAANIPVILVNDTMDQEALDAEGAKVETYVGIDQYEAASLAGTYAAENIKDGKILYLEGISGVAAHADRLNGFKDQCDAFSVVASQTARCDRNEAFNVMQNVLSSNPEV
ncbi:sugar ABC transporter substrate-binding protein, partial [Butyricicoccus sp. Marseille-Q5471]|uniref:sugar ABC transporter substrate-binding protein n=1 Tax=Butyricicoccus sp. Marseille-Q5471 TaxID=3039493 RepID=UPI0024BCECBE